MRLLVTTDAHIYMTPDNKYWCSSIYQYEFWTRYLKVFDYVRLVARVKEVSCQKNSWLRVDGVGVEIFALSYFVGPKALLFALKKIKKELKNVYENCDAAIFRLPSPTGFIVYSTNKTTIPTALEIVYSPIDGLKLFSNSFKDFLVNLYFHINLKKACKSVDGISYVTESTLQKQYPSNWSKNNNDGRYFESHYSTITISKSFYGIEKVFNEKKKFKFVHSNVAMNSHRKGEIILLKVVKSLIKKGYDIEVCFIGDGTKKAAIEKKANNLGLSNVVEFTGLLSTKEEVRSFLISSDLFVLPSKAEGIPRGLIEAMAVGLPCVSTLVGGIPELINSKYLAKPKDVKKFTQIIKNLLDNPQELGELSKNNLKKALEFEDKNLQVKRTDFYMQLKNKT